MDREVSRTLAELERKLQELEQALAAAGHSEPQQSPLGEGGPAHGGEPAHGGGPAPTQGTFTPAFHAPGEARLIDEGLEADAAREHARDDTTPEVVPQPPADSSGAGSAEQPDHDFGESIELSELVRFRDRLQRTLRELTEDYEQIICLRSASTQPQPPSSGH